MDIKCAIGGVGSIFNPLESADVQTPCMQVSTASERRVISHLVIRPGNASVVRVHLAFDKEGDQSLTVPLPLAR